MLRVERQRSGPIRGLDGQQRVPAGAVCGAVGPPLQPGCPPRPAEWVESLAASLVLVIDPALEPV